MNAASGESSRRLRMGVYAVLIALAAGNMIGRLLAVNSVNRADLEQHLVAQRLASLERKLRAGGADDATVAAQLADSRPKFEAEERRQLNEHGRRHRKADGDDGIRLGPRSWLPGIGGENDELLPEAVRVLARELP